jgi:hypothetical protein
LEGALMVGSADYKHLDVVRFECNEREREREREREESALVRTRRRAAARSS